MSVVVPVRHGERTIADCLRSLLAARWPPDLRELVVVDNASTDATASIVQGFPVRYLHERRRGPAAARNRGILAARGEVVAFTDADCVVDTRWIEELVAGFDAPEVGGVAGEIFSFAPATAAERYAASRHLRWQRAALEDARPYGNTSNLAVRRSTIERIGLFDPRLPTGEDKDFGWRLAAAALELRYSPGAVVLHRERASAAQLFRRHAMWGYGAALLHQKHGIPWSASHELRMQAQLLKAGVELARASFAPADAPEERTPRWLALDSLRRLGQRSGALAGLLAVAARPGRFQEPPPGLASTIRDSGGR